MFRNRSQPRIQAPTACFTYACLPFGALAHLLCDKWHLDGTLWRVATLSGFLSAPVANGAINVGRLLEAPFFFPLLIFWMCRMILRAVQRLAASKLLFPSNRNCCMHMFHPFYEVTEAITLSDLHVSHTTS